MTKTALVKKLNKGLTPFVTTNNYFKTLGESLNGIACLLIANSVWVEDIGLTLHNAGNDGRQNFEFPTVLGVVYLTFVWHKMDSGNWEIVAYFS